MNGLRDVEYFSQVNRELCPGCWLFGCLFQALYYQSVWTSEDSKCSIDVPIIPVSGGRVKTAYPRHPNPHTAEQPLGRTGKQRDGGPQNWTLAPDARAWVWTVISDVTFMLCKHIKHHAIILHKSWDWDWWYCGKARVWSRLNLSERSRGFSSNSAAGNP